MNSAPCWLRCKSGLLFGAVACFINPLGDLLVGFRLKPLRLSHHHLLFPPPQQVLHLRRGLAHLFSVENVVPIFVPTSIVKEPSASRFRQHLHHHPRHPQTHREDSCSQTTASSCYSSPSCRGTVRGSQTAVVSKSRPRESTSDLRQPSQGPQRRASSYRPPAAKGQKVKQKESEDRTPKKTTSASRRESSHTPSSVPDRRPSTLPIRLPSPVADPTPQPHPYLR
ncbi:hypothetical protein J4Q44_G00214090 [Coregonus suidteri]|uniref:Uncharacterized protein n=1 Tax=Coregonus suidteri TaxID=861788 RepID=A0AAN8LDG4_9TELE